MTQEMLIMVAILVGVIILSFIGILSRYRKCKSDEVLVVYGKTSGEKSAKLYHGGAAFVWPIIQGYEFLSMKPLQIDCKLTGALSAQNIRVDVPTTITVAISTDPEVMQNAAERLLGLQPEDKQNLITDVVYGQMRLVIADMTIEELNSDRDKFLSKVRDNIDTELRKFGLYLMNINISDIRDAANYIVNLGKEAESKALNEAQANIEEQENSAPSRLPIRFANVKRLLPKHAKIRISLLQRQRNNRKYQLPMPIKNVLPRLPLPMPRKSRR